MPAAIASGVTAMVDWCRSIATASAALSAWCPPCSFGSGNSSRPAASR